MSIVLSTEKNQSNNRVAWVDTLKFLGILAIYVGHFKHTAGKVDEFVFIYHVPLFFFIAGFFVKQTDKKPLQFLKEKTLQLVVPYVFFAFLFTLYISIYYQTDLNSILRILGEFGLGIRNSLLANSLWFFTCLFLVSVLHFFVQKVIKHKKYQLLFAIILFVLIQVLPDNNPVQKPSWIWNIDSALYYYLYYVLGSVLFPWLNKSKDDLSNGFRALSWIAFAVGFLIAIMLFIEGRNVITLFLINQFPELTPYQHGITLGLIFPYALILFFINIKIAKLLIPIRFLGELGKQTLIFCGTENLFKIALMQLLCNIGYDLPVNGPFSTIIYSLCLLVISYFLICKPLNRFLPKFVGKTK